MLMKTKEKPHIITTNNDVYIPAPTAPTETVAEQPSTTPNHENSSSARSSDTRDKPGKESVQDTVRKKTRSGREVHKPIRLNVGMATNTDFGIRIFGHPSERIFGYSVNICWKKVNFVYRTITP
ncbi:hypothetical protein DPMN_092041 [Dreissena polymorpha]|uniref:Uncharacterized protein n=1 Tax=Dreissena polymorpha TaxID=45954 RepID=A0A9D4L0T4_DREPO|nr:hypothetical protein DPMN_092041 [Dreissena polymorpha]